MSRLKKNIISTRGQTVITNWVSFVKLLFKKVKKLLQNQTKFISKWGKYFKVVQIIFQSGSLIFLCDVNCFSKAEYLSLSRALILQWGITKK